MVNAVVCASRLAVSSESKTWLSCECELKLSYAKQYCRYGMEVAMLANKTDAAFSHVAAETVTSVALVLVSVATWEKPLS